MDHPKHGTQRNTCKALYIEVDEIEKRLGESEYLGSDRFTATDITAFCVTDFGNAAGLGIPEGSENTKRWYKAVSGRASAAA